MQELSGMAVGNILYPYVTSEIELLANIIPQSQIQKVRMKCYNSLFKFIKQRAVCSTTGTGRATRHKYDKAKIYAAMSEWRTSQCDKVIQKCLNEYKKE